MDVGLIDEYITYWYGLYLTTISHGSCTVLLTMNKKSITLTAFRNGKTPQNLQS